MRAGSGVLSGIFSNSVLLPAPHPPLRATFPGVEGFGCVRIRRTGGGLTGN